MTPERLHQVRQDVYYSTEHLRLGDIEPTAVALAAEELLAYVDELTKRGRP